MLVRVPAITEETRGHMKRVLDSVFSHKEGEDLDSVVSEVLNDKDVFVYLSTILGRRSGVLLGSMECWDDVKVRIPYGLAIDFNKNPPKTALFAYRELSSGVDGLELYQTMPIFRLAKDAKGVPTPREFADSVNYALQNTGNLNRIVSLNAIERMNLRVA